MNWLSAEALLLDMDGVLVDSTGDVEQHWSSWADRRGLDRAEVLRHAHGSPGREVVAQFVAPAEVDQEAAWVEGLAVANGKEFALPGAAACLDQQLLPVAVVTSATAAVARLRLGRAGLGVPRALVGADDVGRGKPAPDPYLRAASLLKVAPQRCVGVEDSPAGLAALRAAGVAALGVLTTHGPADLRGAAALLPDLGVLRVSSGGVAWC